MPRRAWFYALAAAGVLACGSDSNKPTPIEADGSVLGTLSMTLTETSGTVTGNGNISSPSLAEAINVNGTYTEPNLSVSLTSQCCNPINLTATVGETTMTGTLNGSGFINATITLTRQ
jgi:hypothetical protein